MPFKTLPYTCTLTCVSMPSQPNQETEIRLYLVGGGIKPYSNEDVECKSLTAIFRLCRRDIKLHKESKNIIEYEPTQECTLNFKRYSHTTCEVRCKQFIGKETLPYLLVCGSEYQEGASKVELYDIKFKKMVLLPDLNQPRHNLSSVSFDAHCYVFSDDTLEHLVVSPWWKSIKMNQTWECIKLKIPKILRPTLIKSTKEGNKELHLFGGEIYPGVCNFQRFTIDLLSKKIVGSQP